MLTNSIMALTDVFYVTELNQKMLVLTIAHISGI